ncbi:hypothetical protein TNCV_2760761 [Trichonephila clavipes]|nr:hypothetical protein TNCV_2760761 [Trichonephila clavipes]
MQIKIHDGKNQKKEIRAEIGMVQKRLFIAVTVKFDCAVFFQTRLLENVSTTLFTRIHGMACYRQTGIRATQRSVADAVGVARSVVARLWNRFQEKGNVRRQPGAGRPRATTSTDDRYI